MKCPNCSQEMIDIKDYCVNCGHKLKSDKKGISFIGIIGIFACLVIVGIITCYLIINLNTEEEIEPFLKDKTIEKNKI